MKSSEHVLPYIFIVLFVLTDVQSSQWQKCAPVTYGTWVRAPVVPFFIFSHFSDFVCFLAGVGPLWAWLVFFVCFFSRTSLFPLGTPWPKLFIYLFHLSFLKYIYFLNTKKIIKYKKMIYLYFDLFYFIFLQKFFFFIILIYLSSRPCKFN